LRQDFGEDDTQGPLPMRNNHRATKIVYCVLCAGAILLNEKTCASGHKQSPRVNRLIDESAKKKAIDQSGLLNENPLMASDVPEALAHIKKHPDYTSYHLLLAVRMYYPRSYKEISTDVKVAVLCSALKNTTFLNDWGTLHPSDSFEAESATALLETGKAALRSLLPLLDDDESAPLFGSKEATMSKKLMYRRKDFAYRYASLILGRSPVFHRDPKDRDKDIEALKTELKKAKT
jgi:hypothetical protein